MTTISKLLKLLMTQLRDHAIKKKETGLTFVLDNKIRFVYYYFEVDESESLQIVIKDTKQVIDNLVEMEPYLKGYEIELEKELWDNL